MKKPSNEKLYRELNGFVDDFMLDLQSSVSVVYREPTIRASGFPWCPLLHMTSSGVDERAYTSEYYFKIGTALHELMQEHGGRTKKGRWLMWGDWECSACKRVVHNCTKPEKLCRCNGPEDGSTKEWLYKEVEINYGCISGHIDLILKHPKYEAFLVDDFKTATFTYGRPPEGKYPFRNNVAQISTYCAALKKRGLNVVGWSLIYLDRAKPVRRPRDYIKCSAMWDDDKQKRMEKWLDWVNKVGPVADGIRKQLFDDEGEKPSSKALRYIVENRPCLSMERYNKWMAAHWDNQWNDEDPTECPHLKHCLKGDKHCLAYFQNLIEDL